MLSKKIIECFNYYQTTKQALCCERKSLCIFLGTLSSPSMWTWKQLPDRKRWKKSWSPFIWSNKQGSSRCNPLCYSTKNKLGGYPYQDVDAGSLPHQTCPSWFLFYPHDEHGWHHNHQVELWSVSKCFIRNWSV
jgi:hypothetical protein